MTTEEVAVKLEGHDRDTFDTEANYISMCPGFYASTSGASKVLWTL